MEEQTKQKALFYRYMLAEALPETYLSDFLQAAGGIPHYNTRKYILWACDSHAGAIEAWLQENTGLPPDALTSILQEAAAAQDGLCLVCHEHSALYCGPSCAERGR